MKPPWTASVAICDSRSSVPYICSLRRLENSKKSHSCHSLTIPYVSRIVSLTGDPCSKISDQHAFLHRHACGSSSWSSCCRDSPRCLYSLKACDRTAKSTPPSTLTDLGYEEIFTSGTYFRNLYITPGASNPIYGMKTDIVQNSQITASAPLDTVLQNSAAGFLQALYPPVGETLGSANLRNGTVVHTPLNGFQLIPLQVISTGTDSENSAWLQGSTNCANAKISNDYFSSSEYNHAYNTTQSFYSGIYPMVERTFTQTETNFKNAYLLFDLLNVASIHNASNNLPMRGKVTKLVSQTGIRPSRICKVM